MTLGEVLRAAAEYLERKGVDAPRLDAERLLAHALGTTRLELYTHHDRPLSEGERAAARALIERRGRREPLAYILGEWGFRTLTLRTDERALVPRPETEIVVERALALIEDLERPRVVDVGTGTGAIALAIKAERPDARVTATDTSPDALALAHENAEALGLEIELVLTNLLDGLEGPFDLVVSNPPYVLPHEPMSAELTYEPRDALIDRGQTHALLDQVKRVLDGWLVLEVHEGRAAEIAAACGGTISRDLAGRDRVVEARWTR